MTVNPFVNFISKYIKWRKYWCRAVFWLLSRDRNGGHESSVVSAQGITPRRTDMSNANPNTQTQGNQPDRDRPDQTGQPGQGPSGPGDTAGSRQPAGRSADLDSPASPVPTTKGGRGRADSHCRVALGTRGSREQRSPEDWVQGAGAPAPLYPCCPRKKRSISRLASGPCGSVSDPSELPPDQA